MRCQRSQSGEARTRSSAPQSDRDPGLVQQIRASQQRGVTVRSHLQCTSNAVETGTVPEVTDPRLHRRRSDTLVAPTWVTHHPASTSDGAIPSIPSPAKCNSATPTKRLFTPSRIAHGPKPCVCHWLSAARVSRKASAAEPDATACSASWSAISGTRIRRSVENAIASGVCEPSTPRTVGHPPSALLARTERPSPRRPIVARTSFLQPQQMPASGLLVR